MGPAEPRAGEKGTFHEVWRMQWQPGIRGGADRGGHLGQHVLDAATAFARAAADRAPDLPALTGLVEQALLADLPDAVAHLMRACRPRPRWPAMSPT